MASYYSDITSTCALYPHAITSGDLTTGGLHVPSCNHYRYGAAQLGQLQLHVVVVTAELSCIHTISKLTLLGRYPTAYRAATAAT